MFSNKVLNESQNQISFAILIFHPFPSFRWINYLKERKKNLENAVVKD